MKKVILVKAVAFLCKLFGEEFLFIIEGRSRWSVNKNDHIRNVAYYHKNLEANHEND